MNSQITFKDFLKKYSNIEEQFIDDFTNLFDSRESNENFVVDFDILIKWLGITKYEKFLKNAKKNRLINVDYTFIEIKDKNKSGLPERKYYFTIEAAKEICQKSHKPIADKVRKYFIQVDNLLKKYYQYIIHGLMEKEKMIAIGKKPIINPKHGLMYVFKTTKIGEYKAGTTSKFKKRATSHNCALAEDLELAFIWEVKDKKRVDSCVKNKLKPWLTMKDREIYKINLEEIKKVIIDCDKDITYYSKDNVDIKIDEANVIDNENINNQLNLNLKRSSNKTEYYLVVSNKNIDEIRTDVLFAINENCVNERNNYYYNKYKKYRLKYENIKNSN